MLKGREKLVKTMSEAKKAGTVLESINLSGMDTTKGGMEP